MTQSKEIPEWYVEGDIAASVRKARESGAATSSIVWGLEEAKFDGISQQRIKSIIDSIPANEPDEDGISLPLSQAPSTETSPREPTTRIVSVTDIPYLSTREAARVVGLALEQFDGNTVRPAANELTECDLYWNRQRQTIGLRVVPTTAETIGAEHVLALSEGVTTIEDTQNPSELVVVTNGMFTDEAKKAATDNDIYCFDAGHLEAWLRRAKITREALGTVLEVGEDHDGPLDELVELSGIPSPIASDPLTIERAIEEAVIPNMAEATTEKHSAEPGSAKDDESATTGESASVIEEKSKPTGETGVLYADPSEDGDFDVFDEVIDGLKNGESDKDAEDSDESEEETTSSDKSPEESPTSPEDVPKKELLFELIDISTVAGEPITQRDVRKHGSYPISIYEEEFGSLAGALEAANLKTDSEPL